MSVLTLEGVVEDGRIRLDPEVKLPENAQVYVIIPRVERASGTKKVRMFGPRIADPEQAKELRMEVTLLPDA